LQQTHQKLCSPVFLKKRNGNSSRPWKQNLGWELWLPSHFISYQWLYWNEKVHHFLVEIFDYVISCPDHKLSYKWQLIWTHNTWVLCLVAKPSSFLGCNIWTRVLGYEKFSKTFITDKGHLRMLEGDLPFVLAM
jgi:hypothetical protein